MVKRFSLSAMRASFVAGAFVAGTGVLALGVVIAPVQTAAMTVQEALRKAIRTNPDIKAAQASRRATDSVLDQAIGRYFPEAEISADIGAERIDRPNGFGPLVNDRWRNRRRATLNIRQTLFDGFDRLNGRYQAEARISAAAFKIMARSEIVGLNVLEAYIDVVRHNDLLGLAAANVRRHERLLSLVQARVEGGRNTAGDLDQARERLQAARALVPQIRIARNTASAKFRRFVGVKPRHLHPVDLPRLGMKSAKTAIHRAVKRNPRLAALRSEIDVAKFRTDQFRSSNAPVVALEGSAGIGQDLDGTPGKSNDLRAMLTMRWRLLDGGVRTARTEELVEREFEKVAEYDSLVRSVIEEIETAWTRVIDGRQQVALIRSQLEQNRKLVSSYREEYEADKRSLLDVLDAENSRFATEFELSNVSAIRKFSAYQLIAQTGRLLETFHVQRPSGTDIHNVDIRVLKPRSVRRAFSIPSLRGD
ncbi:MAG: TolC family outer membrane protein [Pseudomonadota bacterium]